MSSAVGIMGIKFDKAASTKRIHFTYGHTTDSMVSTSLELEEYGSHFAGSGSHEHVDERPGNSDVTEQAKPKVLSRRDCSSFRCLTDISDPQHSLKYKVPTSINEIGPLPGYTTPRSPVASGLQHRVSDFLYPKLVHLNVPWCHLRLDLEAR